MLEHLADFRRAVEAGEVSLVNARSLEEADRWAALCEAAGMGPCIILECDGADLFHGEGEGCVACDWKRAGNPSGRPPHMSPVEETPQ